MVDLPKAFGCVVHDLVLAKLSAYGFDNNSLKPVNNFFGCRKFMTEIVSSYCPYLALVGVPQGSILGPWFSIYTFAIFFYAIVKLKSLITRATLPFVLVNQIWTLYWVNLKKTPLQFLHGFKTTIWKLIARNHIF